MSSTGAPTLVLVHAFPMGAAMWEPQRAAAPGWRIVTPSLAGFDGRPLLADNTMSAYTRDLLDVLDEQGVGRAVFGGLSLGGYVLFELLRQAPERVAGLILADTSPHYSRALTRSLITRRRHGAFGVPPVSTPRCARCSRRRPGDALSGGPEIGPESKPEGRTIRTRHE